MWTLLFIHVGNDAIHSLTNHGKSEMRVQLQDFDDSFRFALYTNVTVGSADSNYTMNIGGYYGNAGMNQRAIICFEIVE